MRPFIIIYGRYSLAAAGQVKSRCLADDHPILQNQPYAFMMMLHMLLACAMLVSVTADLTARDVETIAALIGASEKRMSVAISDAIVASEKRMSVAISDAIVASETKLQKFMVDILKG